MPIQYPYIREVLDYDKNKHKYNHNIVNFCPRNLKCLGLMRIIQIIVIILCWYPFVLIFLGLQNNIILEKMFVYIFNIRIIITGKHNYIIFLYFLENLKFSMYNRQGHTKKL